jgi:hypothetical protein
MHVIIKKILNTILVIMGTILVIMGMGVISFFLSIFIYTAIAVCAFPFSISAWAAYEMGYKSEVVALFFVSFFCVWMGTLFMLLKN